MQDVPNFFNSWLRLLDVGVGAVILFVFIVFLVRVLGKRTTSQMNNFDWIITVAIGSLAASGVMLKDVSIADSIVAITVLSSCQWILTWSVIRAPSLGNLVKAQPRLLLHKGELLTSAMKKERISEEDVIACLRRKGYTSLEEANWVILETDGTFAVIPRSDEALQDASLMTNVSKSTH